MDSAVGHLIGALTSSRGSDNIHLKGRTRPIEEIIHTRYQTSYADNASFNGGASVVTRLVNRYLGSPTQAGPGQIGAFQTTSPSDRHRYLLRGVTRCVGSRATVEHFSGISFSTKPGRGQVLVASFTVVLSLGTVYFEPGGENVRTLA